MIQKYNPQWQAFSQELQATIKANSTLIPLYAAQTINSGVLILYRYTKDMDPVTWADESFGYVKTQVYVGVSGGKFLSTYL